MRGTGLPPFTDDRVQTPPFALPADSLEIILDLPLPPSTNKIYTRGNGRNRVRRSNEYLNWMTSADLSVIADRTYPHNRKIRGQYEMTLLLNVTRRGDGDNRIKAIGDWLQSRDIVRNDVDCRRGVWEWVEPERAPKGCRVILRTLENHV